MDPTSNIIPILRIQPLPAHQAGGQPQRPPFAQGQLLQGIISAKSEPNLFTVDIGGRQVLAESTAQLQIGQKLDLQVAALTPRVELQIVSSNTVNRLIGNSIHLIGQQATTFPGLIALAEESGMLPQLNTNSRETLQFYADSIAGRSPGVPSPSPQAQLTVQLLNRTLDAFTTPQSPDIDVLYEKIGNLLQQLTQTPLLSPDTAERASNLAAVFAHAANRQPSTAVLLPTGMGATALLPEENIDQLLLQIGKLSENGSNVQNLLSRLLPLLQERDIPASHPLRQLLTFLASLESEQASTQPFQIDGKQLEAFVGRLGINMEHLLAGNSREEVVRTLKYALLELSQQLAVADKSTVQADQIVKTIELYQLLQIRLSSESLFFLPLPFSFLNQGYLLVDTDRSGGGAEENAGQSAEPSQIYELHLQLEGLGNLQIDIHREEGKVTLKFLTEDVERAKFLAGFRDELDQWLTVTRLESAQFLVGAKEPVKSLLEKIVAGATGIIDTKA